MPPKKVGGTKHKAFWGEIRGYETFLELMVRGCETKPRTPEGGTKHF